MNKKDIEAKVFELENISENIGYDIDFLQEAARLLRRVKDIDFNIIEALDAKVFQKFQARNKVNKELAYWIEKLEIIKEEQNENS